MENNKYLQSLLNNPKTSKIFFEAWDSPVGSSKRAQAGAIITSLKRSQQKKSMDGQGGPGIFSTPGMYNTPGIELKNTQGNTGINNNSMNSVYSQINTSSTQPYFTNTPPVILPNAPTPNKKLGFMDAPIPRAVKGGLALGAAGLTGLLNTILKGPGNLEDQLIYGITKGFTPPDKEVKKPTPDEGPLAGLKNKLQTTAGKALYPSISYPTLYDKSTAQTKQYTGGGMTPYTPSEGDKTSSTTMEAPTQEKLPEQLQPYEELVNMTKEGLTQLPTSIVKSNIMADVEKLKALRPDLSEDDLYVAAGMGDYIKKEQEVLRDKLGLDKLYEEQKNLINAGKFVQKDLTNYIQGRDEYTKKIDTIINDENSRFLSSSLSADPEYQRVHKQQLDLMYSLKGAQNKRYIDLVNDATDAYNARVDDVNNQITLKEKQYSDELQLLPTIAQEKYNDISNTVDSFINYYVNEINNGGSSTLQIQGIDAAKNAASDAIAAGTIPDLSKSWATFSPLFLVNKTGEFMTSGIPQKVSAAIKINGANPKSISTFLASQIDQISNNSSTSDEDKINKLNEIKNAMIELKKSGGDQLLRQNGITSDLFYNAVSALKYPLESYVKTNSPNISTAIQELIDSVTDPTSSEQQNDWKASIADLGLNASFINSLYNAYITALRNPQVQKNRKLAFDLLGGGRKPSKMTADELATNVSSGIIGILGSEINL